MLKGLKNISIYILFPSIFTLFFAKNTNNKEYIFYMLISYILLTIYFILFYKKDLTIYFKKINKNDIKTTIKYWIIGFMIMILANYIINYIILPNNISNNEAGNRELLLNNKFIYPIIVSIFIPFLEEITFRLEFKKNIKNKYLFILMSSITFAILHILSTTKLIELLYIIPYLILGLTFTLIYQKTDNLLCNILAHILHNSLTVILIFLFQGV